MLAKVIVDVPVQNTNRPFDYLVPDRLRREAAVGSRVVVPFGPRKLQGYIIALAECEQTAAAPAFHQLREIEEVSDDQPPLTAELIQLAEWMSREYLCPWITAIQVMVPAVLKGKTEKFLTATEQLPEHLAQSSPLVKHLLTAGPVSLTELNKRFADEADLVPGWIQAGWVATRQLVTDRVTHKKITLVSLPLAREEALQLLNSRQVRSPQMKQVLQFFLDHPQPIPLQQLMAELSVGRSTIANMAAKGWLKLEQADVYRDPYAHRRFSDTVKHPLTPQQQACFEQLRQQLEADTYAAFLLHGITGSGKTEVYLEAIEQTLAKGKEAILLVPEIALTPQMVERLKGRFGDKVAVLHSALSQGERYDEWRKIQRQEVKLAVGARSAIFAPFRNLGLIVIDEEHEASYKQEETPRYHARDVAIWRAKHHQAVLVLGSATPALETYALATRGRYQLLTMSERVSGRALPTVHIVDMRDELRQNNRSMFSRKLHQMIEDRLVKAEQIVLFLNRRGYSTFVMCRACGYTLKCPHCDISLTYHRTNHTGRCHYCGYAINQPAHCPECQSPHIRYFGTGTQKIEEELARIFPGVRVIRMDVDTTSRKGAHEQLLGKFRRHEADILLGTQMIAKGLDFPRVTLVGVIAADMSLFLPDFRAAEKTFQLLTQVAGRAGRHEIAGDVIIQTYTPEHYSIQQAARHDYTSFYQIELAQRKKAGYPPYYRLVLLTFAHEEVPVVLRCAEQFADYLRQRVAPTTRILGPVSSPIARLKDRFRFQLMIKYRDEPKLAALLAQATAHFADWMKQHHLQATIDMDPQVLL